MRNCHPLRLVLVTETFPPHAGGSRYYYYNLFKRLAALQCDVTVLTKKVPGWHDFDSREQTESFHIKRRFHPLPNLHYPQLLKTIPPLVAAGASSLFCRPDVFHYGDYFPHGSVGVMLKKAFHLPFITYAHGEDITLVDGLRFQPKIRDWTYRAADAVIANSEFTVKQLERIGIDLAKVHKITPGLDTSIFYPESPDRSLRERYAIDKEIVLLTVGRLVPRKGHACVLKALASLQNDIPPFKYIIAGCGPDESKLRSQVAEFNLQDKVVFAGMVPGSELNRYYNLADIFVMPNLEIAGDIEGFGMVFLEASAAGKPVVAGNSGGAPEAVVHGETGFVVDPHADGELRNILRMLLSDRELRLTLGTSGLHRTRSVFDWDSRAVSLKQISAEVALRRGKT